VDGIHICVLGVAPALLTNKNIASAVIIPAKNLLIFSSVVV
jgi:hypothetical protein